MGIPVYLLGPFALFEFVVWFGFGLVWVAVAVS